MQKVRKAVVPVAGYGTRFLPATKAQPKGMLPIVDKPAIQYIVEDLVKSGIEQIIIVTDYGKRSIEDHFDKDFELETVLERKGKEKLLKMVREVSNLAEFVFIRQKEQNGNATAILCAKHVVGDEPFIVQFADDMIYNPDKPIAAQLIETYERLGGGNILTAFKSTDYKSYGFAKVDHQIDDRVSKINGIIEKPGLENAPEGDNAIAGIYLYESSFFKHLEAAQPDHTGEIVYTDAVLRSIKNGEPNYTYVYEGKRYDIGNKLEYMKAQVEFGIRHDEIGEEFAKYLKSLS